ncbi:hypothetical protein [Bradyrhizobium sp. Rc3b]|uniref:hypothetical protein n=2 Tax=unclassified Bradyrhizobium TaxID=2631580 RepID=UPI001FCDDE7C|nr:hypothetical protein [Bradyrhizobium sp. Rc3b]
MSSPRMRLRALRRRIISPFRSRISCSATSSRPIPTSTGCGTPPTEGYDPITGTGTRTALPLYGDNVRKIEQPLRHGSAALSTMLTSKAVEDAIRNKLRDGLEIRAGGNKLAGPDDVRLVAKPVVYRIPTAIRSSRIRTSARKW